MSDKKPWEEEWTAEMHGNACECPSRIVSDNNGVLGHDQGIVAFLHDGGRARWYEQYGKLISAAPDLVRALLAVEWILDDDKLYWDCPACGGTKPGCSEWPHIEGHYSDCVLDAALKKAGVR